MSATSWQEKAKAKRESVINLIPREWQLPVPVPSADEQPDVAGPYIRRFLSSREIEITETDASDILKQTTTGRWTAVEVTCAFAHRASLAHQLVNCLHEIFFETAIEDAKALDAYFAKHRAPKGPLHGLPISLKDFFHVREVETHIGYVGWIGTSHGRDDPLNYKKLESVLAGDLRSLGAVLFCKTSVPHSLMAAETFNNIVGYTQNPRNRHLSSGGSSGGEAALAALRGSPLGFGTDIGGSIRVPAASCGVYGLKTSVGRLPTGGGASPLLPYGTLLAVAGPMAPSIDGIRLGMAAVLSQQPWMRDPGVLELPWRDDVDRHTQHRLRSGQASFGMYSEEAGFVTPTPPIKRALDIVARTLEGHGHKILKWDTSLHADAVRICGKAFTFDHGRTPRRNFALSGEEPLPYLDPRLTGMNAGPSPPEATADDVGETNLAKMQFQKAYLDRWMATQTSTGTGRPIDAIICPPKAFPAARPGKTLYYGFTGWVNLLDYCACVIPVTTVDKSVDRIGRDFRPLSKMDQDIADVYDPDLYDGSPVAVQIVCRRLEEEKVVAIAEYLTKALDAGKGRDARL